MENNQCEKKSGSCGMGMHDENHGCCHGGHGHKHMIKWFVKILLVIVIFSFGFEMGEIKGMLMSTGSFNYRHSSMMYGNGYYGVQPMMGTVNLGLPTDGTLAQPQAPAKK